MTLGCPNCAGMVIDHGLRVALGVDWLCAHCGAAGTLRSHRVGDKVVRVREMTLAGDPARKVPWVAAESMPYAERVRPLGGHRT